MHFSFSYALPLLLLSLASGASHGEQLPRWEIGAGLATLNLPDYRGSDERTTYLLPMPYVVYRGEYLRADREGLRGVLFEDERIQLNLSLNGTLPVSDRRNAARAGMEGLNPTVEIGPTLDVTLWRAADQRSKLDLRLPVRGAITVEGSPSHIGWLAYPNLLYTVDAPFGMQGWNMGWVLGSYFSNRRYNTYFYSVAPRYATTDRSAYDARGGYGGSQLTWSVSRRFPRYWVGAFARYDTLRGAVFEDSPLVRERDAFSVGIAISWIFRISSSTVEAQD